MNRNYLRALLPIGIFGVLATGAMGQVNPLPFPPPNVNTNNLGLDWVLDCVDPTSTTSPYSTDWGIEYQYDQLFGAVMGVLGTVNFSKYCFPPSGVTLDMPGRVGFYIGTDPYPLQTNGLADPFYGTGGSRQDNISGQVVDDGMGLTFGSYTGVSGNFSIANIVQVTTTAGTNGGTTTTATKKEFFGKNGILDAWWGASDRYFIGTCQTSFNVYVGLRVDIIGDTARCQWEMQNLADTTNTALGLWFGQWILFLSDQGPHTADYVTVPGLKPLNTDTRFTLNPNANATVPELPLPPYVNYGLDQSWDYGLQIVLSPTPQIPDQTQAVGIDIGKNGFLLGSMTANDGAMPDVVEPDTPFLNGADAFVEKFPAVPVGAYTGTTISPPFNSAVGTDTATVVAYYRSTWSYGQYATPYWSNIGASKSPYSVVLDAPPVIATTPGNPTTFQNAPASIVVSIDNTLGFSTNQQSVPLEDVEILLDLPPGVTDANNPSSNHMVQYLQIVPPQTIEHVTFKVAIDPTLFGTQQYTVTTIPNPGPTDTITGSFIVASQPYLQLTGTANLVTAPWQFGSPDWATIIGTNTNLVLDQDFQVFGWDASAQQYILQTDALRGSGSFVVTNQNVGFVPLGGTPQQVSDLQTGAPSIILQPGWNLIADPYNYAIPLGQLVGVPEANNLESYTFTELATLGYINGSLAYWSTLSQSYQYTQTFSDLMQPNTGYWIYVQSGGAVTITWPAVYQPFIPGLSDGLTNQPPSNENKVAPMAVPTWELQLAARSNGMLDSTTSIGQTTNTQLASAMLRYKAPTAPVKNAISSYIYVPNGKKSFSLARAITPESVVQQTWQWRIFTQNAGAVTLTWPNISSVPANVQLRLVDPSTGATKSLRAGSSITFTGQAQGVKTYSIEVITGPALPVIEAITAVATKPSAKISYDLSVNATTTVTITSKGQVIATLVQGREDSSGVSTATWNYLDAANRPVPNGTYEAVVSSTPSGGAAATKSVSIIVRH